LKTASGSVLSLWLHMIYFVVSVDKRVVH